jgi:curved DNA-binding protein CbpA
MKSFRIFLFEATLTPSQAEKLLGLSGSYDDTGLKQAYKKQAIANHPDRPGGSEEKMKQINLAYELLRTRVGTKNMARDKDSMFADRDKVRAEYQALEKRVYAELISKFDTTAFVNHFETIYGESFESKVNSLFSYPKNSTSYTPTSVGIKAEFWNQARNKVFELTCSTNLIDIKHNTGLGSSDVDISYTMWFSTLAYFGGRKVKMAQSNYDRSSTWKILRTPEQLFPSNKLKKDVSKRKITKSDTLLFLTKEMGSKSGYWQDQYQIDLKDSNMALGIRRLVLMRIPVLEITVYQIKPHQQLKTNPGRTYYPENAEVLDFIRLLAKQTSDRAVAMLNAAEPKNFEK